MRKKSFFGILLIVLILPVVNAQQQNDAGVTPDSFLWGLDKAIDQLKLLLTFDKGEKAKKGIEIAKERLLEVREMVEENKLEAAEKAKEEHGKILVKVKERVKEIEKDNSEEEIREVIEVEKELAKHEDDVEEINTELKVKIKVRGAITEEQKTLINSILDSLKGQTGEVEIEIKNKKDKTKIKIKQETGKSDKEVEDEIEDIEEEKGLADIKKEKALEEIEDAKEDLEELEKELQEHKAKGHVTDEKPIIELIENAKKRLSNAEEAFAKNDFGEAFGQANAAKQLIENAERILEKIVEKFEEEEEAEEEREIEVEIKDGQAKIEVEINDEKLKFTMQTTDKNAIIQEIAERTGLSVEEVTKLAEFEEEKEEKEKEVEVEEKSSQELCESSEGVWKEFPNSGKFCHDECNKPEHYACQKFMSMGCDCGDGKCWNGKSCEIEEKEDEKNGESKDRDNIDEKFLNDPLYCEKDSDCAFQETEATCKSCDCPRPINKYNKKEIDCSNIQYVCNVYCEPSEVGCVNNECTKLKK